jgi:fused signal recognition particle receptor
VWNNILYVAVALILVAAVTAGLVVSTRRRRTPELDQTAAPEVTTRSSGATDADTDVAAPTPAPGGVIVEEPPEVVARDRVLDRPEKASDRWRRLRARLAGSQSAFGRSLLSLLSRDSLDEEAWEELEDTLISADIGVGLTTHIVDGLRRRAQVDGFATPDQARAALREELLAVIDPDVDRSLAVERHDGKPAVVMVVGVNGNGKTTLCGRLARVLVADDKDVLMAAADTFRAAAVEQLQTWGDRVGVAVVRGPEGGDPASVAFEAVKAGIEGECDVVIIDTAGRLHTKTGLMDELGKVKRVAERQAEVTEVLLVLDATTGQNGLVQARVFREVVDITGIALTKLDGSAKGGIVFAVQNELGVPVKLVGLGEGADDLAPFDPRQFVDELLS